MVSGDGTNNFQWVYNTSGATTGGRALSTNGLSGPFVDNVTSITLPAFRINSVPVPAAFILFGSGLLGLVGMARRKKS